MNIEIDRSELAKKLLMEKSEVVLAKISQLLNRDTEIVAYTTSGKSLTKKDYLMELEKGAKDIREGRTLSSAELRNEIKSWSKS